MEPPFIYNQPIIMLYMQHATCNMQLFVEFAALPICSLCADIAMNEIASSQPRIRSPGPVYLVLILVQAVSASGLTTIYTTLTSLYKQYAGSSNVGWAVTAYLLFSACGSALCGRLGDLLGRRRMILVALAVSGTGAAISALVPSLMGLIAGCAMQGLAGSLTPLDIGLARELLPPKKVSLAVGIISAAGIVGAGVTYLFAGWVTDHFAPRGAFLMKTALAAVTMIAVIKLVPKSEQPATNVERIDFVRGILFAPAIAGILIGVDRVRVWGWLWASTLIIPCVILLVIWARHQLRQATPLINIRLLLGRQVLLANCAMACMGLGCIQVGQMLSLLLQQPQWTHVGFGLTATAAGWAFLAQASTSAIASPMSGKMASRYGARRASLYGAVTVLGAWSILTYEHSSFPVVIGAAVVNMIGLSFVFCAIYNLIVEATPAESTSETTGMASVVLAVSMAVASQILFKILASQTVSDPRHGLGAFPSGYAYTLAFGYIVAMCAICLCVLLAIPRRQESASLRGIVLSSDLEPLRHPAGVGFRKGR